MADETGLTPSDKANGIFDTTVQALAVGAAAVGVAAVASNLIDTVKSVSGNGVLGQFVKGVLTGDNLRDWRHATKIFIDGNHRLAPKFGHLFHTAFDLGAGIKDLISNENASLEYGLLVKSFSLPKFDIDTRVLNAYNRPNIVQTKMKYGTVAIKFHDDSDHVITKLWQAYYEYHYRDSTNTQQQYQKAFKYTKERDMQWGYQPLKDTGELRLVPFFKSIRLYSLNHRKFTEYVLINPTIKSFRFGEHANNSNEFLDAEMVVEFETVTLKTGHVKDNSVVGFAELHYDKGPSPLSPLGGGTQSLLGEGGLFDTAGSIAADIESGNIGAAIFKGARASKNFIGQDLGKMAAGEVISIGKDVISGINPLSGISIPTVSNIFSGARESISKGISTFSGGNTSSNGENT